MTSATHKRQQLRALLHAKQPVFAPGVYDGFGLRLIEDFPIQAAYVSGNAVSACLLGEPDVGLVDLTLLADHLSRLNQCTPLPLICDADTGYGGVVNIRRTVRTLEAAGVAAIHIEDQLTPKRCAQLPGARQVVSHREAVLRIEAACAAREELDAPLMIVGRTDAAGAHGLRAAIDRACDFVRVGAEAVFIELKSSPEMPEQLQTIARQVNAPCMVNMSVDPRLQQLAPAEWAAAGIGIGIFPALARASFGHAVRTNMQRLLSRDIAGLQAHSLSAQAYADALNISSVEDWERRFSAE
jgi:2-methylisocitrate lyase-like PEP mutase family enzyme